jgi:hypothetical protein
LPQNRDGNGPDEDQGNRVVVGEKEVGAMEVFGDLESQAQARQRLLKFNEDKARDVPKLVR